MTTLCRNMLFWEALRNITPYAREVVDRPPVLGIKQTAGGLGNFILFYLPRGFRVTGSDGDPFDGPALLYGCISMYPPDDVHAFVYFGPVIEAFDGGDEAVLFTAPVWEDCNLPPEILAMISRV